MVTARVADVLSSEPTGDSGASAPPVMTGPMWMPEQPPTFWRLISWHWQPVPLYAVLFAVLLAAYAYGVITLHRRGLSWPLHRILAWTTGSLAVVWVTNSGIEGYGMLLFSPHMFQHMTLSMLAPILLLLGAPVTLLLRALPARHRIAGPVHHRILAVLHSRFGKVVAHPAFTWPFFMGSLYGIYFSPLFDQLMSTLWGHYLMLAHFLASGLLFFGPVLAIDPWPRRSGALPRFIELLMGTPLHAFFGVIMMMTSNPLVDFFTQPPADWGIDPINDQWLAGSIAWMFGEIPTLGVMLILARQWHHSDARAARRADRQARRDGDAALKTYNAWLRGLHGLPPTHTVPNDQAPANGPASTTERLAESGSPQHGPTGGISERFPLG